MAPPAPRPRPVTDVALTVPVRAVLSPESSTFKLPELLVTVTGAVMAAKVPFRFGAWLPTFTVHPLPSPSMVRGLEAARTLTVLATPVYRVVGAEVPVTATVLLL